MNDLLHITIAIIVIVIMKRFFVIVSMFLEKRKEKTIRITMDAQDNNAFHSVMHTLRLPGLLGMRYDDGCAVLFMIITVRATSYELYMTELKKIQRIEVV